MSNRIEDDEILFTTLILMHGEPPQYRGSGMQALDYAAGTAQWGREVKDTMKLLGHKADQGLFSSFVWWSRNQYNRVVTL